MVDPVVDSSSYSSHTSNTIYKIALTPDPHRPSEACLMLVTAFLPYLYFQCVYDIANAYKDKKLDCASCH